MKNRHFLRLMQVVLTFTALYLYTFTPVVNAQWGVTVPNPIMEYHYTYDNNGNITKIEDKVNGAGYNQSFTYDEVDRLSSAIGPYGVNNTQVTQTYSYNEIGDPTDIPLPVTNPNENGNVTDYNGKHIDYDYENRPVKITNSNNNTVTEFAYDYSGQRVYTKVSSGTITSEDYYIGNIYEEKYSVDSSSPIISASTTTVTYVYAGSIRVAGLTTQTTATGTENNTLYYHGDHLGSSSIITDGSGTVVRNISYQPWGNVQSNREESGASTLDPNHKFTGQILDDSTNLYYYGARYYDPELRRFITPDSIIQSLYDPQNLNRYVYTRNNPLRYIDPSGHLFLEMMIFSAFTDVAFRRTNGDVHNFRDAARYAAEGAAIGAAMAAASWGISALDPRLNLYVYYQNGANQVTLPLSGIGNSAAGFTGAITLAQLAEPNYPMYAAAPSQYATDASYEPYKKPAEKMDLFSVFFEGAIGEEALSTTNQLLRRNRAVSSSTKYLFGVNRYSAYAITKGAVSRLPRYTGALTVSLFIFDADQILSNPDLNNTQKTSLTIGKASTALLSYAGAIKFGAWGAKIGVSGGPWGIAGGSLAGAVFGGIVLPWAGDKLIEEANK